MSDITKCIKPNFRGPSGPTLKRVRSEKARRKRKMFYNCVSLKNCGIALPNISGAIEMRLLGEPNFYRLSWCPMTKYNWLWPFLIWIVLGCLQEFFGTISLLFEVSWILILAFVLLLRKQRRILYIFRQMHYWLDKISFLLYPVSNSYQTELHLANVRWR